MVLPRFMATQTGRDARVADSRAVRIQCSSQNPSPATTERRSTEPKVRGSNPLGRAWNPPETAGCSAVRAGALDGDVLERGAVPVAQVGRRVVRRLQELQQAGVRLRGRADRLVGQEELPVFGGVEGRLRRAPARRRSRRAPGRRRRRRRLPPRRPARSRSWPARASTPRPSPSRRSWGLRRDGAARSGRRTASRPGPSRPRRSARG